MRRRKSTASPLIRQKEKIPSKIVGTCSVLHNSALYSLETRAYAFSLMFIVDSGQIPWKSILYSFAERYSRPNSKNSHILPIKPLSCRAYRVTSCCRSTNSTGQRVNYIITWRLSPKPRIYEVCQVASREWASSSVWLFLLRIAVTGVSDTKG